MKTREIIAGDIRIGAGNPLVFIAGPCVIESEESTLRMARKLKEYSEALDIPFIFKSSYDKANRTSVASFRGPGIKEGLRILQAVKNETGLQVLSDVHSKEEVAEAAQVLDIIQIPAFLSRQTDLIVAVAKTQKPVNIKKGQFLSPLDVKNIVGKAESSGNKNIIITERGASFGYNNLVVDMRSIPIIHEMGIPVMYDATHSVQLPGGQGSCSGGQREYIEPLSRAAVAAGCDAVFMEVHENPESALCDGPNMLDMESFAQLAKKLKTLNETVRVWG
ncbi:MAG: 3-deoxy-8-phosphooctulonate synthase [Nitrospira sp.]|nr:3-deoxy-8-phosphooctulonate synthase [bacterium]MBL7049595.1 3-deoxy-8-phosphooctulonate synthase [Nitrospira sp.]